MRPTEKIIKTYPQKGPLSQYRFEKSVPFNCFRCKTLKTSKLIAIFSDDWEIKLCNGCYGLLLSLYENYQDIILEEDKETHKNIIQKDYSAKDKIVKTKGRGAMQTIFANLVKNNYGNKCAITGISTKSLLIGAHIIPWSENENRRMDPKNGLSLSILIEKCFDRGLLTIDPNYLVILSKEVESDPMLFNYLKKYNKEKITLPKEEEFYPSIGCLEHHWNKFSFNFNK